MTSEEAILFIADRYGNDPGVEEALDVLMLPVLMERYEISVHAPFDAPEPWKASPPGPGRSCRGMTPMEACRRMVDQIREGEKP